MGRLEEIFLLRMTGVPDIKRGGGLGLISAPHTGKKTVSSTNDVGQIGFMKKNASRSILITLHKTQLQND